MYSLVSLICLTLSSSLVLSDSTANDDYKPLEQSYGVTIPSMPTMPSPQYNAMTSASHESYGSDGMSYPSVESSTVLSPYELYQKNWCHGLLRPSAPKQMPDTSELKEFQQKYAIPQYWALWYRSCYLPHHGLSVAQVFLNNGLGLANTSIRQAVGGANGAISSGSKVLHNMLDRARQLNN